MLQRSPHADPAFLVNIYKELKGDGTRRHGTDSSNIGRTGRAVAQQRADCADGLAASHRDRGWERFTDAAIAEVNRQADPVVFLLSSRKAASQHDKGGRHWC